MRPNPATIKFWLWIILAELVCLPVSAQQEVLPGSLLMLVSRVSYPVEVTLYAGADSTTVTLGKGEQRTLRVAAKPAFLQTRLIAPKAQSDSADGVPVLYPVTGGIRYVLVWQADKRRVAPQYLAEG